ncbi:DNA polymerase delta subunit 3 [Apophysomyces ossiformis]|uniref:DNA polymerase delta subunit 3 n=1 Tax=Apophysomyces ossiformis TaxID=679940 RepID=A0A8H7BPD4_9FUNG|nr:DNA polymerase delta subunit 3 [Apophysomyces ossiformis]
MSTIKTYLIYRTRCFLPTFTVTAKENMIGCHGREFVASHRRVPTTQKIPNMSLYKDFLDVAVLQEKKPISYKALARHLGIHVNTAKQALFEYASRNPSIHAVYCITGTIATATANVYSVRIVNGSELEETKKEFKTLTGVHVYGVAAYGPKVLMGVLNAIGGNLYFQDFSVFVMANKEIPEVAIEDRIKCGAFKNANSSRKQQHTKPIAAPSLQSTTVKAKEEIKKAVPEKPLSKAKETITVSNKGKVASTTSAPTNKRSYALSFDKAKPKQATASKAGDTPKTENKGKTDGAGQEISDEELDRRMAMSNIQASDIFSDDDENMEEAVPEKKKRRLIIEEDEEMEDAVEESEPATTPVKDQEDDQPEKLAPAGKVMRKVLKKKTSKNARGFLGKDIQKMTEDVWEWEAVDAERSDKTKSTSKADTDAPSNTAKSESAAKTKSSGKKGASGEQRSLLSFWGKR